MEYILGLLALLGGGLLFYRNKAKSAEALNGNIKTKESLNKEDASIAASSGRLTAEQERRDAVQSDVNAEVKKDVSLEDLTKFFNDRKPGND